VEEIQVFWVALWVSVNSDFNNLLISFLFSQMTYAIRYKAAVDRMAENELTQNFIGNMTQYGIIINLLFLSVEAKLAGLDWDIIMQSITESMKDKSTDEEQDET